MYKTYSKAKNEYLNNKILIMDRETSIKPKNLIQEHIELRQLKAERESMLRTNQYYIAQVSQMEIKISELKASLQAKETEILYLNSKLQESDIQKYESNDLNSLENQILLLQAENEHLKMQVLEAGEVSQLKIQLEHAIKMKETFEEKYREAKTVLLTNKKISQTENLSENYVKKETFIKMQEEAEIAKNQVVQYQNQCSILSLENEELMKKLENYEKDQTFKEKNDQKKLKNPNNQDLFNYIVSTSTNSSDKSKNPLKFDESSVKSCNFLPKSSKLNSSKIIRRSVVPLAKNTAKNEVAEYCPSFMRNKKLDLKSISTPSLKKNHSFADDFPEDEEF